MRVNRISPPSVAIAVAAALLSALWPSASLAQTQDPADQCLGKNGATTETTISGCTSIIESNKFSGQSLSLAFLLRGKALGAQGKTELAIADYSQAISVFPENVRALNARGQAYYYEQKKYDLALADFAKSIAIAPNDPSAWAFRGDAYYDMGQPDRALTSFSQAIKLDPKWMWPRNDRGELYLDRGDTALALQDFDQAVSLEPEHAIAWNNRCRANAIAGRLEQALSDCNEAIQITPNFVNHMVKSGKVSAFQDRGLVRLKSGDFRAAIEDFDKADQLTPKNAEVLYGRGVAKSKEGDAAGGAADILAANAIRPDIAEAFRSFGIK